MKKRSLKNFSLNKKSISNLSLESTIINGGHSGKESCYGVCETYAVDCHSFQDNCTYLPLPGDHSGPGN